MKISLYALLFVCSSAVFAQSNVEMTPQGFAAVEFNTPNKKTQALIDAAKSWADYYNKKGYDVYDVTENSLSIDAWRDNAYFIRSLGERYDYNIKYTLKVNFKDNKTYTLTFILKEVYNKTVLAKTTVSDFFAPDGKLKADFTEAKPSLENTANKIINSFSEFIAN